MRRILGERQNCGEWDAVVKNGWNAFVYVGTHVGLPPVPTGLYAYLTESAALSLNRDIVNKVNQKLIDMDYRGRVGINYEWISPDTLVFREGNSNWLFFDFLILE